ncbi:MULTISPECIES: DJ-1/PfpI family protein [unclassified Natrinema]|uniref:DJ-1/PfpI family protein n=1 Tax=unclassified Natrinema TaxID=2622230 RepID=UPI00026D505F|nr:MULTISPECIES: DJ-1/PfpI family protein [unclassified Natrinema]AFO55304.1 ThiJ/PfpI domain-containing protein [Natrinema sp. J7-2]
MGTNRARAHPRPGASLEPRLVTLAETDLVAASHGLRVEPDGTLGDPDILLVPGGGWTTEGGVRSVVEARTVPAAVGDRFAAGSTVASVCTGAMILAEADVLAGRPATTLAVATDDLAASAATVHHARVVDAGGVTAGIDLALWLLEREFDAAITAAVETEMEHDRRGEVVR